MNMPEYPGLLIAIARRRIKQAVLRRVASHRLAPQQFWTLIELREHPGTSLTALAQRVRIDAPTASRVLTALSRRELVRTRPDPRDRRRTQLYLSPAGERLARGLAPIADEVRGAIVEGMTPAELEMLAQGLRQVIDNLDRLEARSSQRRTS